MGHSGMLAQHKGVHRCPASALDTDDNNLPRPACSNNQSAPLDGLGNSCESTTTSTVTAIACPLLCSQSRYSGTFPPSGGGYDPAGQTEGPRPPLLPVCGRRGPASWSKESGGFFVASSSPGGSLAQLELEGGDLHRIQADGGLVGQRRAGVHQRQGHGLQQLQVQVLEQARDTQLQAGGAGRARRLESKQQAELKPRFEASRSQSSARRCRIKAVYGDGEWGSCCSHTERHVSTSKSMKAGPALDWVVPRHLALDAAQVEQVEVAGQVGLERGEGLQGRDAASLWQDGQRQDLVVQEGVGHVTEDGREAGRCTVHHLEEGRHV
ncbi:hypothetical protein EYF80_001781 [Liparis tanakae]|uniref:Uncharacterized protein n=1 Tax=Liparis tanakae TaxID=230148 RepID=A0A4Z2JCU2_9TELE|nr:hypothetical protein EYF80_001781 [Liparis tanakae]